MSTATPLLPIDTSIAAIIWLTVGVVTLAELILLGQAFLLYTPIRLGSAVAGMLCVVVTIMDALIAYGVLAEVSYLVLDGIGSVIYFDVIMAVFLNVGRAYHHSGRERNKLYWVACVTGIAFTLGNIVIITLRAEYGLNDELTVGMLGIFPVGIGLVITLIAFTYALMPLLKVIKMKEYGDTDAYAREFWYFTTVAPLHIFYVIFLFIFMATSILRNTTISRNLNLLLRMFPLLATSLLPYPPTLQYFKRCFFPNQSIGADLLTSSSPFVLDAAPSKRPRNDEFLDIIIADGDLAPSRAYKTVLVAAQPIPMVKLAYTSSTGQQVSTVHPMPTLILPPPRSKKSRALVQSSNRILQEPLSFSENSLPVTPPRSPEPAAPPRALINSSSPTAQPISESLSLPSSSHESSRLSDGGSLRPPASESPPLLNRTSLGSSNSESPSLRSRLTPSWFSYEPSRLSTYKLPQQRWTPLNLDEIVETRLEENGKARE